MKYETITSLLAIPIFIENQTIKLFVDLLFTAQ